MNMQDIKIFNLAHGFPTFICASLLAITLCGAETTHSDTLESMIIEIDPKLPREVLFTDKGGAHFFGEAANEWSRSYHGFYSNMHEFVDGWNLKLQDQPLGPVSRARLWPDRLERTFKDLVETIYLLDDADLQGACLLVEWRGKPGARLQIRPRIDMRFLWEESTKSYEIQWSDAHLSVASKKHLVRSSSNDWPVWATLHCSEPWSFQKQESYESKTYSKGLARKAMPRATLFQPGVLTTQLSSTGSVWMCIQLGDKRLASQEASIHALANRRELLGQRRERLEDLVTQPGFACSDKKLERAAAWCRLSLDQLIMQQRGLGIYAGYPWFTTYWGRDSFIVLPGALLVTGQFETARRIISGFAKHQLRDNANTLQGRLPNFVTVDQTQYATADGTWWWVRALQQYEDASGDIAFGESLYSEVSLALDGALRHRVDAQGFILHGDGETWMDAGGEQHPFSPRGNRAIEVQALFYNALDYGAGLAKRQRDRGSALRWSEARSRLKTNFGQYFFDPETQIPFDHLNADGSPDKQVRPNVMLARFAAPSLFAAERSLQTLRLVRDELTYPWGVGSLSHKDPNFHPWHVALDRYYYDEAYHNGDVWLWLTGPLVAGLVAANEVESAWQQTLFLRDELLDRGVAGSLREIRDAVDTQGKDEYGGACAQAWSLSEFQRTLVEDYIGVKFDLVSHQVWIQPMLPDSVEWMRAQVAWGGISMEVCHQRRGDHLETRLVPSAASPIRAWVVHASTNGVRTAVEVSFETGETKKISWIKGRFHVDGSAATTEQLQTLPAIPGRSGPFQFAPSSGRP